MKNNKNKDNSDKAEKKRIKRKKLRRRVKEGAIANAERDLALVNEWP